MNKFKNSFVVFKPFQPLQKKLKILLRVLTPKADEPNDCVITYTKKLIAKNNNEIQYCAQNLFRIIHK